MPPSVASAARVAYRRVLRQSALTFTGDEHVMRAFRLKMRTELLDRQRVKDDAEFLKNIALVNEITDILRKNIVQASLTEQGNFRLNITPETELGSNEDIKKSRTEPPALHYSARKRAAKTRLLPHLSEEDIDESFVRGSGPGGQSINKTANNVQLLHKPTGLRISCQETRSLQENRLIARKRLLQRLDELQNPGLAKSHMKQARKRERERQRSKKRRKKERLEQDESQGSRL